MPSNVKPEPEKPLWHQQLSLESLQPVQDGATRALFILAPWSYVTGFLIINYYFARQGIAGLGLVRSEYVLVGVVYTVITVLNLMVALLIGWLLRVARDSERGWKRFWALPAVLLAVIYYPFSMSQLFDQTFVSSLSVGPWGVFTAFNGYFAMCLFLFASYHWVGHALDEKKADSKQPGISLPGVAQLLMFPILVLMSITIYAPVVYQNTSPMLSGAKPLLGKLYFKPLPGGAKLTLKSGADYAILLRTEQNLYVRSSAKGPIIEVPLSALDHIEYAPLGPGR